jgi:hypothetical protein
MRLWPSHYDAVHELRVAWHREDYHDVDAADYFAQAYEVALSRGVRVLAVRQDSLPVGFAQLESIAGTTEITQVYVRPARPDRRDRHGSDSGGNRRRRAGGRSVDLRRRRGSPQAPLARLGFRPVCVTLQFLRLAANTSDTGG